MPYFSQSATVRRQAGKSAGARPGRPPPACEVHAGGPGPACYDAFRGCAVHARPVSSPGPAVGPCGQRQKFLSCFCLIFLFRIEPGREVPRIMSAVGLQPWPFLFSSISAGAPERRTPGAFVIHGTSQERLVVDDGKKTCVRTSSAGSAIIHPNSRSSRRGAFFGAIKIEQNVNFVQSRVGLERICAEWASPLWPALPESPAWPRCGVCGF